MSDLIDRQAAIEVIDAVMPVDPNKSEYASGIACGAALAMTYVKQLPSAQPDNQVNLCDSCKYSYPDCPSEANNVIFGNGKGNDNICACNKYLPFVQSDFDIAVKINKAYDDGYEAGYLQGRHDWGDLDE